MKIKILIELPLRAYIDVVANQIFDVPVVGGAIIAGHRLNSQYRNSGETAHWIKTPGMNEQCSACGAYFPLMDFEGRPFEINFCPHCGAEMESEEQA